MVIDEDDDDDNDDGQDDLEGVKQMLGRRYISFTAPICSIRDTAFASSPPTSYNLMGETIP